VRAVGNGVIPPGDEKMIAGWTPAQTVLGYLPFLLTGSPEFIKIGGDDSAEHYQEIDHEPVF